MTPHKKDTFGNLIDRQLRQALKEVGAIEPWFDEEVQEWVFEHPLYPDSCSGATRGEVIRRYPLYLRQFIEQRLAGNLSPRVEATTRGRGGKRPGAGRPNGSSSAKTRTVRLPEDIALWLKSDPSRLSAVRRLMVD